MPEKIRYNFFSKTNEISRQNWTCKWLLKKGYLKSSGFGVFFSKPHQFHLDFRESSIANVALTPHFQLRLSNQQWNPIIIGKYLQRRESASEFLNYFNSKLNQIVVNINIMTFQIYIFMHHKNLTTVIISILEVRRINWERHTLKWYFIFLMLEKIHYRSSLKFSEIRWTLYEW